MSDIGLQGVAGLIVLLAAGAAGLVALLIAIAGAVIAADRRRLRFAEALRRYASGPLAMVLVCLGAVAWAWNGPNDLVDQIGPAVAGVSVVLGVAVTLVLRSSALTKTR